MTATVVENVHKTFHAPSGPLDALAGIDLIARPGESVAVIGRNGAGKSTLLQVVAGVLAPTSGTVRRPGRVASLLELGSGFHPDLTGAENLDLGIALASQTSPGTRLRTADIVEFSGLSESMDQPVKHYSDGMKARLACSIAVHTEPELLIVDEVLAVGDASFQRQVLTRIDELVGGGATLLLVTHSLDLARAAARRVLWLEHGRVFREGDAGPILDEYEATSSAGHRRHPDPSARIEDVAVDPGHIESGDGFVLRAALRTRRSSDDLRFRVDLRPVAGEEPWMRAVDELPEHRELNLVATTAPAELGALAEGRWALEVRVQSVPITATDLEATLVVSDGDGRIHDELTTGLGVGRHPGRPKYVMSATVPELAADSSVDGPR
jgi:ABC-type polysaccharide/polyol phosphate transport system ATPase subunit